MCFGLTVGDPSPILPQFSEEYRNWCIIGYVREMRRIIVKMVLDSGTTSLIVVFSELKWWTIVLYVINKLIYMGNVYQFISN